MRWPPVACAAHALTPHAARLDELMRQASPTRAARAPRTPTSLSAVSYCRRRVASRLSAHRHARCSKLVSRGRRSLPRSNCVVVIQRENKSHHCKRRKKRFRVHALRARSLRPPTSVRLALYSGSSLASSTAGAAPAVGCAGAPTCADRSVGRSVDRSARTTYSHRRRLRPTACVRSVGVKETRPAVCAAPVNQQTRSADASPTAPRFGRGALRIRQSWRASLRACATRRRARQRPV